MIMMFIKWLTRRAWRTDRDGVTASNSGQTH